MKTNKQIAVFGAFGVALAALVHFGFPGGWGGLLAGVGRGFSMIFGGSHSTVPVPLWLVGVIWIAIMTALGAAILVAMNRRRTVVVETPVLTKADIFGLRWRWNYEGGEITGLTSYCPKCNAPVSPKAENRHGFLQLISYQCACRRWSKSFQCTQVEMFNRVRLAIAEKTASHPPRALSPQATR